MSEANWKKGISKQGKILTKAFSAILNAMYPSTIPTGTGILELDFGDVGKVGIFGTDKAQITDEGVAVGGSLMAFQESLEALGYVCLWGTNDRGEIMGFKTEPDIIGSKLWMQPLEEQTIGDDTQTKKKVMWGIVTKFERASAQPAPETPAARPGKLPPKPRTKEPEASKSDDANALSKRIMDDGLDSSLVSDIYEHYKKEYKPGLIRLALALIQG